MNTFFVSWINSWCCLIVSTLLFAQMIYVQNFSSTESSRSKANSQRRFFPNQQICKLDSLKFLKIVSNIKRFKDM
ncbi:hypothetical protein J437_LFUL008379 [Ladona fulva]|uniref:Uncharacterized protein n=1 Tax=Ladona fulva TaxID=123851 RepID=A0A8K0K9R9_LADFU|nr:hypothetical protein J437_LFUL008379 [Ladona fulva]